MEEKSSNYDNKAELELLKKKIENWDIDTVSFWLKMNCFPELINTFKEEEITGISLLELKEADLKDLGITKIGKKKTFLKLLNDLKQMQSSEERKRKLPKLEASEIEIRKDSPMLGEGEFGFIFQAIYRKAPVVIKELKDKSNQTAFFREGEIAYSLKHPSIIECFGYAVLNDTFYLLLEYAKHGPLNKYLEFHKDQILINQLIEFSLQVAKGMEFIEKNSIVHRDLTGDNILLDEEKTGNLHIKISDFGLSRKVDQTQKYVHSEQSMFRVNFSSPEVLLNKYSKSKSDVWSFGIVVWQIFSFGKEPYINLKKEEILKSISSGERLLCPVDCPDPIYSLIKNCWNENSNERPSFAELTKDLNLILSGTKIKPSQPIHLTSFHSSHSTNQPTFPPLVKQEQLFIACKEGNVSEVKKIIRSIPDLNWVHPTEKITCLMAAVEGNYVEIVEVLLRHKLNLNVVEPKSKDSALHLAVINSFEEISLLLMEAGAELDLRNEDGASPLHLAARCGNFNIVQTILIKYKISPNIKDKRGDTPLHFAVRKGYQGITTILVQHGADFNSSNNFGETPKSLATPNLEQIFNRFSNENTQAESKQEDFHFFDNKSKSNSFISFEERLFNACIRGIVSEVNRIISFVSNLNWVHPTEKITCLMAAVEGNYVEIVIILLKNKSKFDINKASPGSGDTALHMAIMNGFDEITLLLLDAGADAEKRNEQGESALHLAARRGSFAIIKSLLLEHKVPPNIKDRNGNTALHIACSKNREEVAAELVKRGADLEMTNKLGESAKSLAPPALRQRLMNITPNSNSFNLSVPGPGKMESSHNAIIIEFDPFISNDSNFEQKSSSLGPPNLLSNLKLEWEKELKINKKPSGEDYRLGEGAFGEVYQGNFCGSLVAIKKFKIANVSDIETEAKVLRAASHPNVVQLIGYAVEPLALVTEFVTNGDLFTYIQQHPTMSMSKRVSKAEDVLKGLRYLHRCNIVHRDLKTTNLLVSKDGTVKIGDFGLAKLLFNTTTNSGKGTPVYMAPETFGKKGYDPKLTDIYAVGIIFWEIFSGKIPYDQFDNQFAIMAHVMQGQRLDFPQGFPPILRELIKKLWAQEPQQRCSLEKAHEDLEKFKEKL